MMAKPIRALQLHYPMIQFLIIVLIHDTRHLCTRFRIDGIKAMSSGISGGKQVMRFANMPFARWRHFYYYNYQNPSEFCFLVEIITFVI